MGPSRFWSAVALVLLLVAGNAAGLPAAEPWADIAPFLKQHCHDCHGERVQKAELRLDSLAQNLADEPTRQTWHDVLDRLRAGDMPPADRPRPDRAEAARVMELLAAHLDAAEETDASLVSRPVLRRLNRLEYRNTLRDLLYLEQPLFRELGVARPEDANGNGSVSRNTDDPTAEFPSDELEQGFDNIGGRLVMSDFLLRLMIASAEKSLQMATVSGPRPEVGTRTFARHIRTDGPGGLEGLARPHVPDYDLLLERYREPGAASNVGRIAPSQIAGQGVGASGRWRITVRASAHNRRHDWHELIRSRVDEPFLLGLYLIDSRRGAYNEGNPNTVEVAQWELPDDGEPHDYTVETWIDSQWLPWLGWENAPYERSLRVEQLVEKYIPEKYRPRPPDNAPEADRQQYQRDMVAAVFTTGYAGPHIRVHSLTLEPLPDAWPPRSHTQLYGATGTEPVAGLLQAFATRAWRRPVAANEVARYVQLAQQRLEGGATRDEALRTAYTALLVSPQFVYLRDREGEGDFNRAWRLSYFLWSSMPDEELFQLAARGSLGDPLVRRAQVERMLQNRNAASFVRRFTERWLRTDRLGSMPPPGGFYFHRQMEEQMRRQVDGYFAELLTRNGPIRELIESDYTVLNERMSQWIYQRTDVWGDRFRRVPARPPHGGGLLTMPAVMTATANGVDTSPIVRGVWVLESVLGTPPKPPPANVEPLSPDLRGAQTIRQQLERHRAQEACRGCHAKIDPLGFAFENFDELGLWRTHYRSPGNALPIDTASQLPDGREVADVEDLKRVLVEREEQVVRNLAGKLLMYAKGRVLTAADRHAVERMIERLRPRGYPLRDLVHLVAETLLESPPAE